ncbi:hypothetical protein CesoFtcFv8_027366 [Champsocephalus esox]|uniref:X-linked retinitis pigmentosa GTPase regulator n=1 Tax=Champsocephalus esox TaxID=159716 RepID=A0AAN7YBP5_9TELE|nr:hypothetical protein CesoFtcFv8_027366 [Champsocephalus esox]
MAGETQDEIPESGAVFTFGKSKFAENVPSKFWLKNDVPLKIACGDEHTALITEHGKLFMFGSNNWGQLGLGSKATASKPTCVKALKCERVQTVACGRNHTLLCTAQGAVFSSGGNSEGQLGLGDCEERTSFQRIAFFDSRGPIRMLAAGSNTSAALTEGGDLFMWGDNTEGQIGLGKEGHAATPQEVSVGRSVSWVSCGYYHSAFITEDGGLYTFGECDSGKLGLNTEQLQRHRVPQLVGGLRQPVTQVSCGGGHTVALTEDDVFTFGLGQFGQLGHGTFTFESRLPRRVEHFKRGRVCHVTCGENHTAVITDGGLLYTFGDGRHGKLGLGDENFTNQFKPTLCPRFLKYDVQAVTCGGCHMVALARPRDPSGSVTLEEEDVTEDFLLKPYVELLGDSMGSSTLQRSLSARVRRRERERSPEHFGSMFTPGFLQPPPPRLQPHSQQQTGAERLAPTQERSVNAAGCEKIDLFSWDCLFRVKERTPFQRAVLFPLPDELVENLTDTDSVKGLGETSDFLNMTHVMKTDAGDSSLTLSPVQKQRGVSSPGVTHGAAEEPGTTLSQNKENLVLAMEELQRPGKNKSMADIGKAASRQRVRPTPGGSTLMEVARKSQREVKAVQSKPIAVQSVSSPHTLRLNEEESLSEVRSKDLSKKSKNEKNQKEAEVGEGTPEKASQLGLVAGAASVAALLALQVASLSESGLPREERTEDYSNKSAVSINIIPQSPEGSKETSQEEEEEKSRSAEVSEKEEEEVSHSVEKVTEDDDEEEDDEDEGEEVSHSVEKVTEDDEDEGEEVSHSVEKVTEDEDEEDEEDEGEEVSHSVEKVTEDEDEEDEGEEVSHSVEKVTEDEDEEDEGEEVSHSVEKVTEDDEDEEEDCNTLQTEDDEDEDKSSAEEEEEASGTAGSESEDETESKESRGSDEDEEEEGSSNETESAGRSSESEEGEGSEEEEEEGEGSDEESKTEGGEEEEGEGSDEGSETEGGEEEEGEGSDEESEAEGEEEEEGEGSEKEGEGSEKEGEEEGEGSEKKGEGSEKEVREGEGKGGEEEEGEGSETEGGEEGEGSDEGSETEGGEEEEGEGSETEGGEEGEGSDEGSETEGGEEEEGEGSETEGGEEEEGEGSETEGGEEEEGEGSETERGEEEEGEGSETEGGEEEEGEGSETEGGEEEEGEGSETEGGEEEEGEKDEKEEEEEEVVQKTKSAGVQRGKARSRQRSGVKGQAAGEEEEFWDDVLPQYLNLK